MPINLVSFAPQSHQTELSLCLSHIGYGDINRIPFSALIGNGRKTIQGVLIVQFGDIASYRETLIKVLTQFTNTTLAILQTTDQCWDKEILNQCTEFLTWPCCEKELAERLDRLSVSDKFMLQGNIDTSICPEFAQYNLIGRSPMFIHVLKKIKKIARCEAPVLIEGETGTGKELAARAIHYSGLRGDYPFIPVNCGAIPDNLIENELFGHEKGAYTDAKNNQPGMIEQAQRGTLFLDEIDSLSQKAQVTLLRFLQDQKYLPLGGKSFKNADVRIIAATNQPLDELVRTGEFRHDLFYRLNIMKLHMPAIRERSDDIPILSDHFLKCYQTKYKKPHIVFHPDTLHWMMEQTWTGNVRELENFVHREFLLSEGQKIHVQKNVDNKVERRSFISDRRQSKHFLTSYKSAKARLIKEFEQQYLSWLMSESNGNVTLAAQYAGQERRAVGKLLKKHCIDPAKYKK